MATSSSSERTYPGEYTVVFDAVCRGAVASKMKVNSADPATGVIQVAMPMSMMSWGENVAIQVGQLGPGQIQVSALSKSGFALTDWGKNKKNLDKLFLAVDGALAESAGAGNMPGAAPVAPAAPTATAATATWHPDPSGRHQYRYWDGVAWSDQVSDSGVVSSDPL